MHQQCAAHNSSLAQPPLHMAVVAETAVRIVRLVFQEVQLAPTIPAFHCPVKTLWHRFTTAYLLNSTSWGFAEPHVVQNWFHCVIVLLIFIVTLKILYHFAGLFHVTKLSTDTNKELYRYIYEL